MDIQIIDRLITGRVEPHIYAFETCSVPNYLKIGDTYRPVYQRIEEWRRHYKNLRECYNQPAVIKDKYFRDYSVHAFVENIKGRKRITESEFKEGVYHSNEFFREATTADIDDAIKDIQRSYEEKTGEYKFYSMANVPERDEITYKRNKEYTQLRDNQEEVVKNFNIAIEKGRTKLLLYAVMRFGKSITAMSCAESMPNCRLVVIVSAKADVKDSWAETICTIKNFEDFKYADGNVLKSNPNIISETLSKGSKLALCLTLQDISTNKIKSRYKELFNESIIDLLIVDETHFGARAEQFSKVLQDSPDLRKEQEAEEKDDTFENLNDTVHALSSRVQLHLSGTPYRILLGNEFSKDDIICQCTYPDIIKASKEWDSQNLDTKEEWENPYYGFPQMIRFAFNFNASSLKKIEELRKKGKEFFFDALFEAKKDSSSGKYLFVNEREVLDFLSAINSGNNDSNILSFLDNPRIKAGELCHHVVMVLPRRSSCEAMEYLLERHRDMTPLSEYAVMKISGIGNRGKDSSTIRQIIKQCESEGKKTLSLTVSRMLTGTTVPEWDTMIFLKGTSSPQEYDQAVFRLQNQYIKEYKSEDGRIIRYNMKPQTLLVDFSPERMFILQEQRAFYTSVNSHGLGNDKIEKEIERELEISPILYINHDKLQEVTAVDIIDKIRKYNSNRSILDEALEVGTDYALKNDEELYSEIMRYAPIGSSSIIKTKAHDGKNETDADIPNNDEDNEQTIANKDKKTTYTDIADTYEKRLATYFSHILFFAYLTNNRVKTLSDICEVSMDEDNRRIMLNLGLNFEILRRLSSIMHPARREMLEFKIANINDLSHDDSIPAYQKVENAMKQFGRWSEAEIITPTKVASDMIAMIPEDKVDEHFLFLDIASKEGEFANAIFKRFGEKTRKNIYSLPTSGIAYEFTRKVYHELGLPIDNIISTYTTYDLIGKRKEQLESIIKDMNINAIVGNPPYQEMKTTDLMKTNGAFSSAIYPNLIKCSISLNPLYVAMITPSRWMTKAGQGIDANWAESMINSNGFITIADFVDANDCFNNVDIKGGVNYFLYSPHHNDKCCYMLHKDNTVYKIEDYLNSMNTGIVIRDVKALSILKKVVEIEGMYYNKESFASMVSPKHFFDKGELLNSNWKGYKKSKDAKHPIKYYVNHNMERSGEGWIRLEDVPKNLETMRKPKIFIPEAGGTGNDPNVIGKPFYGGTNSACSYSYIVVGYDPIKHDYSEEVFHNILGYMKTKFFRYMVSIKKKTQHNPRDTFQFVPLQNFTEQWTDAKLYAKYKLSPDEIAYIDNSINPMT